MTYDHKRAVVLDRKKAKPSESFTKGALPQTLRPCTILNPNGCFSNASDEVIILTSAAIAGKSASLSSDAGNVKQYLGFVFTFFMVASQTTQGGARA